MLPPGDWRRVTELQTVVGVQYFVEASSFCDGLGGLRQC